MLLETNSQTPRFTVGNGAQDGLVAQYCYAMVKGNEDAVMQGSMVNCMRDEDVCP
jgi:hypothetical protein